MPIPAPLRRVVGTDEALLGRADSLLRLDRPARALEELSTLDDLLDEPADPASAMLLARSLALRAWALNGVARHADALTTAGCVAGIEAKSNGPQWRLVRSEGSLQTIVALGALGRSSEQRTALAEMTSRYGKDDHPQVRENVQLATELVEDTA